MDELEDKVKIGENEVLRGTTVSVSNGLLRKVDDSRVNPVFHV